MFYVIFIIMKIIITESQKEQLDYDYLSSCIKRRIDLDGVDDIVNESMEEFVSVRPTMEGFFETIINYTYDRLDIDYGIEKCWGDETFYRFSTPIKQFLDSRYESIIKKYFEDYYN